MRQTVPFIGEASSNCRRSSAPDERAGIERGSKPCFTVADPVQPAADSPMPPDDVTRSRVGSSESAPLPAAQLLPLVYEELRKLARQRLAHEKLGQTLQATALVHEVYMRLAGKEDKLRWASRGHFFAAAAEAMRRILVERARRRRRIKHGGGRRRVDLDSGLACEAPDQDLIALDEALACFAEIEPIKAELVKLRFFAGLTVPQAAETLGISIATAERYWTYARVWLYAELEDRGSTPGEQRT